MTRKILCLGAGPASAVVAMAAREREWMASGDAPSHPVAAVIDPHFAESAVGYKYVEWASQWMPTAAEARAAMKRSQRKLGPFRFEMSEAARRAEYAATRQREVERKARRVRGKAAKAARRRNR